MPGIDFAAELDESSALLVQDTPSESLMEGYAEKVQSEYLKGTQFGLHNANLEDSQEFIKEVLANVASAEGISATVEDVERWSKLSFDDLSNEGMNMGRLSDGVAMASAQAGLNVASDVYGESMGFYSLSGQALQDGKITVSEAVQLGASAVSFASTMISGMAGGCALGPIGAVAGLVMGGINYLSSDAAAHKAYWEARKAQGAKAAEAEQAAVDEVLGEVKADYYDRYADMWDAKDSAISEVADAWSAFEDGVGVRFGLRYFPGSVIPPRAGTYRETLVQGSTRTWVRSKVQAVDVPGQTSQGTIPMECASLAGCLYFPEPHPARVAAIGYSAAYAEMLTEMDAKRQWLTTSEAHLRDERDYVPSRAQDYPSYDYYWKTFRAFDAYLVNPESAPKKKFWIAPSERDMSPLWKSYQDLAYDRYCGFASTNCKDLRMPYTQQQRALGFESIKAFFTYEPNGNTGMASRALSYVEEQFRQLAQENGSIDVIKTRIMGDLIQTSNAVGGELATSIRLRQLMAQMGGDLSNLSAAEMRTITALDSHVLTSIEKAKRRDGLFNGGMLVSGIGAFGFGAYRKWGKKR